MVVNDTLLIRHLPSELSHKEKEDFLKHFGAIEVKILGSEKRKSNLIYAKYESSNAAQVALKRLHQLEVLGQLLCVELARGVEDVHQSSFFPSHKQQVEKQDHLRRQKESFLQKLNSWTKLADFNYPPPVHLYYQYSPPTHQVLENICKAMTNVPKFYTQVLHLMNKMNLPCPFTNYYPLQSNLNVEKDVCDQFVEDNEDKEEIFESMSEEESEIESDPEVKSKSVNEENLMQLKRKKSQNPVKMRKFIKLIAPLNTQPKPVLRTEEVFEKIDKDPLQRKIELKLTPGLDSIQESIEAQNLVLNESFGIKVSISKNVDKSEDSVTNKEVEEENVEMCITAEGLAANRISTKDQRVLPVFKNYQAGAPSCRLYIKNLSKQVVAKDLHFIYRRYTGPLSEDQGNMFDIRLMQEGRMKGQAFVSLQSVELAQKALKETNGYILKDKPMVVQFARSAVAK